LAAYPLNPCLPTGRSLTGDLKANADAGRVLGEMSNFNQIIAMDLKDQVRQLVDSCKDDVILQEVLTLLHGTDNDWWLTVSDMEKARTTKALQELRNGQSVSHESVMQAAWQKLGK
jgi:hypothetical protein